MDVSVEVPKKLYRYNSFSAVREHFKDLGNNSEVDKEKWRFAVLDGYIFPTSPFYFNDPYDCDVCIDSSFLLGDDFKRVVLSVIKKYCKPNRVDINRIMLSDNLLEDARIVLAHHGMDISEGINRRFEEILVGYGSKIKEYLKVVCFSEYPDSILMWSHYAYYHTGFCIEYDLTENEVFKDSIKPVKYTSIRAVADKNSHNKQGWFIDASLIKSDVWSYEHEWRIVIPDITKLPDKPVKESDYDDFYINVKKDITAVYLGAKAPEDKIAEVLEYYKGSEVTIYQMELEKSQYKLVPRKLQ